jgi:hypothetical protein
MGYKFIFHEDFRIPMFIRQKMPSLETRKSISKSSVDVSVESRSTEMIKSL